MKRFAAIAVALALAVAPGAFQLCQILCASAPMQMHAVSAADARAMSESGATQPGCHGMERTEAMASPDSAPCGHDDAVAALSVGATRSDVLAAAGIHASGFDAGALVAVSCAERGQIDAGCERLSPHRFIPLRL